MSDSKTQAMLPPSSSDRQGFNRRWYADSEDLQVFRPTTAEEARSAFQTIVDTQGVSPEQVQITCGRHCYEEFVYNNDTKFIIDMSGVRSFDDNPQYGDLALDVGFGNWDMYRTANNVLQKTLPAGSCYSVGLGGHITGGGYGLLSRLDGLTIDHLVAVDIALLTAPDTVELVTCTADNEYSDLLWGIKGGGGGQFGLITRYYFETADSPDMMYSSSFTWDWLDEGTLLTQATFNSIVQFFEQNFTVQDPDSWKNWAMLHLNHMDAGNLTIPIFTYYSEQLHGDRAAFEKELEVRAIKWKQEAAQISPLSKKDYTLYGHPTIHSTLGMNGTSEYGDNRQYTYLEGTQEFNGGGSNQYGMYKSAYLRKAWTSTMLTGAYEWLTTEVYNPRDTTIKLDMSQSLIQVDSYGGKINTVASDDTAIPQRSSIMKLQYQTYWDSNLPPSAVDVDKQTAQVDWINKMYTQIYSDTGGFPDPTQDPTNNVDGCYYNYPDRYLGTTGDGNLSRALGLYFGANLDTLTSVKQKYNPDGWFGNMQSIQGS